MDTPSRAAAREAEVDKAYEAYTDALKDARRDVPDTPEVLTARVEKAYTAYADALDGRDEMHRPFAPYADLHDLHKNAWRAAVMAALAYVEPVAERPMHRAGLVDTVPDADADTPLYTPEQRQAPTVAEAARREPEHLTAAALEHEPGGRLEGDPEGRMPPLPPEAAPLSRRPGTAPAMPKATDDEDEPHRRGRK